MKIIDLENKIDPNHPGQTIMEVSKAWRAILSYRWIDYRKALVSIDPKIVLNKLHSLGVPNLSCLTTKYVDDRSDQVWNLQK